MAKRSNKTARVLNLLTGANKDDENLEESQKDDNGEVRIVMPQKRIKVETTAEKEALSREIRKNLEKNLHKEEPKVEEHETSEKEETECDFQYVNVMEELYKQQDVKNFIA